MKPLKQVCAAFVLSLTLALSAFAGEIETGVAPPPMPQHATTQGEIQTTVTGEIETGVTATDPVTEIALNLLQSLLSLF